MTTEQQFALQGIGWGRVIPGRFDREEDEDGNVRVSARDKVVTKSHPDTQILSLDELNDLLGDDGEGKKKEKKGPKNEKKGPKNESDSDDDEEEEEEEEEVEEIMVAGKAYYASGVTADPLSPSGFTRDSNGPIYAVQSDDDVGDQVGEFVDGSPRFHDKRYAFQ